jgi:glycosyltransferase involved in cell wall biosynthesis
MTPLLKENQKLVLQILGSGPMEDSLIKEVKERDLENKVNFMKPVSHAKLPGILGAADIFINHMVPNSRSEEAFGAVNIEAMSCGLPAVLSRVGGIPYVIREEGVAMLVEPRNIVEIRAALRSLIANESLRKEMGKKARAYVKKYYGLEVIAEKYHNMLTGTLA